MNARRILMRGLLPWMLASAGTALAQNAPEPLPDAARYQRLHATAVAFSDTFVQLAERYPRLNPADLERARGLIRQAEAAARDGRFADASAQVGAAYDGLRGAIADAVAGGQSVVRRGG